MALNFGTGRGRDVSRQQVYRKTQVMQKADVTRSNILTSPAAVSLDQFLSHSMTWACIVCILTLWALYIDDVRTLAMPKESDPVFATINWIIFGIFIIEWVADSFVHVDYFLSLTSFMDLMAALSLVPIQELLNDANTDLSVARIARTFRALRILRATRAAAMALKAEATLKRAAHSRRIRRELLNDPQESSNIRQEESKSLLEATLLERGNVKMLLGVLILLMGMSFMDYSESDRAAEASLSIVDISSQGLEANITQNNGTLCPKCKVLAQNFKRVVEYSDANQHLLRRVFYLEVAGSVWISGSEESGAYEHILQTRRKNEIEEIIIETPWGGKSPRRTIARIDLKPLFNLQSLYSIYSTTFSIFVIIGWAMSFRRDYYLFVLRPVRRMVSTLKNMTNNPRDAIAKGELYAKSRGNSNQASTENLSEMELIEACVAKFGLLLKVGFGEAGMNIIARNMTGGSGFDPVIPGTKVMAVFGFCDIRNFTDCCEVLEEETMVFTNSIARIVHNCVHSSGGVVNKNIGDAFLMVWKLKTVQMSGPNLSGNTVSPSPQHTSLPADKIQNMSHDLEAPKNTVNSSARSPARRGSSFGIAAQKLASAGLGGHQRRASEHGDQEGYIKGSDNVLARQASRVYDTNSNFTSTFNVNRYVHHLSNSFSVVDDALEAFIRMRSALIKDADIQKVASDPRLQNKIPNYTVKMGYGLHLGWGIEGAIGSSYKVDASYLSPHVNLASRLEAASKQYKVQLLLSDAFVKEIVNESFKAGCRPIDVVTVKGSNAPVTLYTYQPNETPETMDKSSKTAFRDYWLNAFDSYVSGDWSKSKEFAEKCLAINPNDGPCQTLLGVLQDGRAPPDWKGYRALTNK